MDEIDPWTSPETWAAFLAGIEAGVRSAHETGRLEGRRERFEVTRATSARARAERPAVDLAAADLPEALGVPAGTAARTVALIKPALHSALRAYNDAHAQDPAAWRRTQQVNPGPLPRVTRAPAEVPVRVQQARAQDDQHHLAVRQPQHGGPRL